MAIDDFGTGYSSLSYLRNFAINVLKVDQSFVHEISADPVGNSIVCAVISMGKSLGHRVVAEGEVISVNGTTGRVYLGVFAGQQRTGGYSVHVDSVERVGDRLNIRSTFTVPPSAAVVIQVITSPAQLVSIARDATSGVREAVLIDQSGAVRARAPVPQSTP